MAGRADVNLCGDLALRREPGVSGNRTSGLFVAVLTEVVLREVCVYMFLYK